MNSMDNVSHFQQNAHQVLPGTAQTVVHQQQTPVQLDLITMELNVFHTHHAKTEKSGTIL